jgi:hypothetical protein
VATLRAHGNRQWAAGILAGLEAGERPLEVVTQPVVAVDELADVLRRCLGDA